MEIGKWQAQELRFNKPSRNNNFHNLSNIIDS